MSGVRARWRPRLWMLFYAVLAGFFTLFFVGLALSSDLLVSERWFAAICAPIVGAIAIRVPFLRVGADEECILVHRLRGNVRIPWHSVEKIVCEEIDGRVFASIEAPVIYFRSNLGKESSLVLRMLASYQFGDHRNLARRAAEGMERFLEQRQQA